MCETVASLSDDQVEVAASYFSVLVRGPNHEDFDADLAAKGAALHKRHCGACHVLPNDENAAHAIGIPLNGQRAGYIRYALGAYASGARESLLEAMAHEIRQLESADFDALINYYSSYRYEE